MILRIAVELFINKHQIQTANYRTPVVYKMFVLKLPSITLQCSRISNRHPAVRVASTLVFTLVQREFSNLFLTGSDKEMSHFYSFRTTHTIFSHSRSGIVLNPKNRQFRSVVMQIGFVLFKGNRKKGTEHAPNITSYL